MCAQPIPGPRGRSGHPGMDDWVWHGRVYWEDTDAGGVVYHARYLHFFERARSDWLRRLGFAQRELRETEGCLFAVTRMALEFLSPARLDDELEITVRVRGLGRASLDFDQRMLRAGGQDLARAQVRAACLDADAFRPKRMPGRLLAALETHTGTMHK